MHKKSAVRMWGRGSHTICVRNLPLEVGKGKEHVLCKKSAIRMWGRGSHTICVRNLPLEGGKGKQHVRKEREGNPEVVIMVF